MIRHLFVPDNTTEFFIEFTNSGDLYVDDLRIQPAEGHMKGFVYDRTNFRLMAELDENNYATLYYYDHEGNLYLTKKETEKGIKTIQEAVYHQSISND